MESERVERTEFVKELLEEVDGIDFQMFPPPKEVDNGETSIAEMTLYCKKLFAVSTMYARETERLSVEIKYASNSEDKKKLLCTAARAACKNRITSEMMYASIKDSLAIYDADHIGIRQGWVVITKACRHHGGIEGLLKYLGLDGSEREE